MADYNPLSMFSLGVGPLLVSLLPADWMVRFPLELPGSFCPGVLLSLNTPVPGGVLLFFGVRVESVDAALPAGARTVYGSLSGQVLSLGRSRRHLQALGLALGFGSK